jgi:hypothetical protein
LNEQDLGSRLVKVLDEDLRTLDPHIVRRLGEARSAALSRAARHAPALATASGPTSAGSGAQPADAMILTLALLVLAAMLGMVLWYQTAFPPESIEVDLLADEVPPNAYLDRGFQQWLSGSLQR